MQRHSHNGIEWLEFDLLSNIPHLTHAVFLRHGGCSKGPYKGLNTGFYVGDNLQDVEHNISLIKEKLRGRTTPAHHFVSGQGVHGKAIAHVSAHSPQEIPGVDGLITAEKGISLMMKHADCQVALFYDPKNHAIANVHAGWRGSVANIYREAIHKMCQTFGSRPHDLIVCISPSLGPNEAEFIHYKQELPKEFWQFQPCPHYFDFWTISEHQLKQEGILAHHIEIARMSTYSNPIDFYSYRRDKITGRHATCIHLS